MNKYLKFEYWNTCDLGNIYYQGGQHFIFYLDADVGEPIHEEVEEGQENGDGDFIPTYRRQMKRYRIRTGLIPDYLIDAIQRMKLHDHIELTFKSGEVEQIYNIDVEPEWQFEKYAWQGTVTLTFDMDESITVGACCDNLIIANPDPDPYWVATDGSDETGTGEYSNPWLTLGYAVTQVTTPGETINIKAGTYNLNTEVSIPVGVSIKGAGEDVTILNCTYRMPGDFSNGFIHGAILLHSSTAGTDGNQSISHLTLDGGFGGASVSTNAILVRYRSNVIIHDCIIKDFDWNGIFFYGLQVNDQFPTTWMTGCKVYNCTITNCTGMMGTWEDQGLIAGYGTDYLQIYNNTLSSNTRAEGDNGNILALRLAKRTKYYNNKSYKPSYDGEAWNFHLELRDSNGGGEIYDNEFYGGDCAIDVAGSVENTKSSYDYTYQIHGNYFEDTYTNTYHGKHWIDIEGELSEDVYIYNNLFNGGDRSFHIGAGSYGASETRRIYFYYNIAKNMGTGSSAYFGNDLWIAATNTGTIVDSIYILNNIFLTDGTSRYAMKILADYGDISNVYFHNNIITDHTNATWLIIDITNGGTVDNLNITYNNLYNNFNSNTPTTPHGAPTNYTFSDNITTDPAFVSTTDFHLQAGSPCINAGIDVGLTTDYDGQAVSDPPEIGAYEY